MRGKLRERQRERLGANQWARWWFRAGERLGAGQVAPAPAYGTAIGKRREAGVGDAGSGSLVNSPKLKIQFCNFNVSPSS
jgi:hypothetical protein